MITNKAVHEIQMDKPTLTLKFIRSFDAEWEKAVQVIKRKVCWVKKDGRGQDETAQAVSQGAQAFF